MIKKNAALMPTDIKDGDSFDVPGDRVRLARVDAPEWNGPYPDDARQAKEDLESLIRDKVVIIDVVARDAYGRAVAEISIDGENVNDAMIRKGWVQGDWK